MTACLGSCHPVWRELWMELTYEWRSPNFPAPFPNTHYAPHSVIRFAFGTVVLWPITFLDVECGSVHSSARGDVAVWRMRSVSLLPMSLSTASVVLVHESSFWVAYLSINKREDGGQGKIFSLICDIPYSPPSVPFWRCVFFMGHRVLRLTSPMEVCFGLNELILPALRECHSMLSFAHSLEGSWIQTHFIKCLLARFVYGDSKATNGALLGGMLCRICEMTCKPFTWLTTPCVRRDRLIYSQAKSGW